MFAIAKLHNFCINERLLSNQQARQVQDGQQMIFTPTNVAFTRHEAMLRDESAFEQFEELADGYKNAWSNNRKRMVREIEALKLTHPGMSAS